MSLYDKASLVFSGKAAAGKDGTAYNIKPVEKLKVDEYIENGGFDTDSVWTKNTDAGQEATISGGKGRLVGDGSAFTNLQQNDVFEADKVYKVSLEAEIREGELKVQSNGYDGNIGLISESGKHSFYFTGISGSPNLVLGRRRPNVDFDIEVDNVSVREVEQKAVDFTMVRGSNLTATREAPSGLIEKGRENLLLQSNQFDTTWIPNNTSETGGKAGYDGSSNAWELKMTGTQSGTNEARVRQDGLSVSGVCTYSVYAKAGNVNWVRLLGVVAGSTNPWAYFDLSGNGAVGTTSSSVIDTSIESIGSGWFRVSMTHKGAANDLEDVRIIIADADESPYVAQNSYIYIQNSQLEQGLVATPYINTTDSYSKKTAGVLENEPRYDYNGGDAALLLEPERQNKFIHSEYLASSSIFKTNSSFTANQGTSPEGLNNAAKMNEGTASGNLPHNFYYSGIQNSKTYTISFYAKKIDRDHVYVNIYSGVDSKFVFYDLSDGTVATASLGDVTASISDAGSGWYRISYTRDTASTGSPNFRIGMSSANGTVDYQGNGSETLFYGVQWEEGSYATSYIPTYGSVATREGEGDSLSSFSCELDKPLSKKYTLFLDLQVDNLERPTTNFDDIFVARAADGSNYAFRLEGYHDSTPDPDTYSLRAFMYKAGQSFAFLSTDHTNGIQLGVRNKIAIVFDEEVGVKVFHNGALEKEKLEAVSFYDVKFLEGGNNPRSKTLLHGMQAYDVALSDEECLSLTT